MVFCFEIDWWANFLVSTTLLCFCTKMFVYNKCGKLSYLVVVDNNMNLNIECFLKFVYMYRTYSMFLQIDY